MTAAYFVVGANHRTCSGAVRDGLTAEEPEIPALLDRLRAAGLEQAVWLSTCDRVEVLGVHPRPTDAARLVTEILAGRAGVTPAALADQLFIQTGNGAVRHVFAVASSLDSQIIGEPHVLGQMKDAHRLSAAAGLTGPELEALLQAAYAAAKRVRSETPIAEGATSVVAAAVQVARDVHGGLERRAALVLGLGDMGGLVLDGLMEAGLGRVSLAAPNDRRGEAAARRRDAHFVPWADVNTVLDAADIVVTATGLGRYTLTPEPVKAALKRRRYRPVFVIDAAIPADVDPGVAALDDVFVYDLADLERVALRGRVGRQGALQAAWRIVDEQIAAFTRGRAERAAVPAVAALRAHFEAERRRVLAEHAGLDAGAATRLLVNRLLHRPSEALRAMAAGTGAAGTGAVEDGGGGAEEAGRLLTVLFGLDETGPDRGGPAEGDGPT